MQKKLQEFLKNNEKVDRVIYPSLMEEKYLNRAKNTYKMVLEHCWVLNLRME